MPKWNDSEIFNGKKMCRRRLRRPFLHLCACALCVNLATVWVKFHAFGVIRLPIHMIRRCDCIGRICGRPYNVRVEIRYTCCLTAKLLLFVLLMLDLVHTEQYYFNASRLFECAFVCVVCTARVCSRNFHTREPISQFRFSKNLYSHSHTSERRARIDKVSIIIFLWFNSNKIFRCVQWEERKKVQILQIKIIRYLEKSGKTQTPEFIRQFNCLS